MLLPEITFVKNYAKPSKKDCTLLKKYYNEIMEL